MMKHGTGGAYNNHRCRCDSCRGWKREASREYRERNRSRFAAQRRAEYAANPRRFKEVNSRMVQKRKRILARYKVFMGCRRCGYKESPAALEFHHRDRNNKSFSISERVGRAWAVVKAEVRKCDVLCSNCHRIVEAERW